ncbi:novel plant SNARE 11-like [Carya illinoinensis]|uniref:novel plant SNARE 11-like n=1 Tax=Carya illinoinensis TaxID=32201 RepID=UPI001C728810|nr:novel plant SNARE 11-like [Carya illinoinensis]
MAPYFKLSALQSPKIDEERDYMRNVPYASIVRSLMYAMMCTRPNISQAISLVSRYMHNLGRVHWHEVKWILRYATNFDNKRIDLFDGGTEGYGEQNVMLASSMTNQQLVDSGNRMMDETDQVIERSKKVVHETNNVGIETAAALKAQTNQMSRIVNEMDSIHFSIKKASQLVKELGRQVATDRCIMALLLLIVIGVVAIIIVKVVNPSNKDIQDIPRLASLAMTRRLLWNSS